MSRKQRLDDIKLDGIRKWPLKSDVPLLLTEIKLLKTERDEQEGIARYWKEQWEQQIELRKDALADSVADRPDTTQ